MEQVIYSITDLKHHLLKTLENGLSEDLYSEGYDGEYNSYSLDTFRRLYNDALESMYCYRILSDVYRREADEYRQRCDELENCIRETCEE